MYHLQSKQEDYYMILSLAKDKFRKKHENSRKDYENSRKKIENS